MRHWQRCLASLLLSWGSFAMAPAAWALTNEQAWALAQGDTDDRIAAMGRVLQQADARTQALLQAMSEDAVKLAGQQVLIMKADQATDAVTGEAVALPEGAEDVMVNNRLRGEIDAALAALKLLSPEAPVRTAAALALLKEPDAHRAPLLRTALGAEQDPTVKPILQQALALIDLTDPSPSRRQEAVEILRHSAQPEVLPFLNQALAAETTPTLKAALEKALREVQERLRWGDRLSALFSGVSLGSILLLVALGLAITYGLMGVINMAHGELMMIGAYATYVVQLGFRQYLPAAFDYYLLAAIPLAFVSSALVGALMERVVLRHLYGRPLETLLATWGISLVLMQAVRSLFGAQNVGVENPVWMSGAWQLLPNVQLPWNRLLIVAFAALVLLGMALLISRTRLGLFVRGVTQNRPMASCMGINTARIDTYAFALGSGIAGLAGCALSQVGNVGPDLGQNYIVDAFMVVVLGGVGQLAGSVYAALGLGLVNKWLEGWTGAVLAKIAVLVFIIIFIQKRPQGLFAMKGRSAEA